MCITLLWFIYITLGVFRLFKAEEPTGDRKPPVTYCIKLSGTEYDINVLATLLRCMYAKATEIILYIAIFPPTEITWTDQTTIKN